MYHLSMEVSDYFSTKDHFIVEDLFNFPNVDDADLNGPIDNGNTSAVKGNVAESPTLTGGESFTSSLSSYGHHFSTDFPEPCEEVAELEWLSNFMEDCFSNKDHQQYFSSSSSSTTSTPQIPTMPSVPAKTRSKRSRANPTNWASRRLPILPHQPAAVAAAAPQPDSAGEAATMRRCLHCGSDKTPQWRMGPLGPKTLCNACGVRYKSGRLVPEYRPAASPTFMVSEHSNSHRKVVELRRQKELQQQKMMFWSSAN